MKIQIQKNTLLGALRKVVPFVNGKDKGLPILNNALFVADPDKGTVTITGTDLNKTIVVSVECDKVVDGGVTTLPVRLLSEITARVIDGTVEIEVDQKHRAVVRVGQSVFTIQGLSEDQFPTLPSVKDPKSVTLPSREVRKMLSRVSYAASKNEADRKVLCSILFKFEKSGKVTFVATDGRRLALAETTSEQKPDEEISFALPISFSSELNKFLDAEGDAVIEIEKSQVSFTVGSAKLYSKLFDEGYPNYRQVIPKDIKDDIEIDRVQLINAIDRVSVLTGGDGAAVLLTFSKGQLKISTENSEIGNACDAVPIKYDGPEFSTKFNPVYLIAPLNVIEDDAIRYCTSDGAPIVIRCSEKMLAVLMPLRVQ